MNLNETIDQLFNQLEGLILKVDDQQYVQKLEVLSGSTIGQHLRHIMEFFVCLHDGYEKGLINYDKRERDIMLETNRSCAINLIHALREEVTRKDPMQQLRMEVCYSLSESVLPIMVATTYERELIYNIEHTVHHMALIKIGVKAFAENIELPSGFGVAVSTIKHQNKNVYSHVSAG